MKDVDPPRPVSAPPASEPTGSPWRPLLWFVIPLVAVILLEVLRN